MSRGISPFLMVAVSCLGVLSMVAPASARSPADVMGQWDVTRDQSPQHCRVTLNSERSDKGDYFIGMPTACRHTMPVLAKAGRWTLTDTGHLVLAAPAGQPVLDLVADGDAYSATGSDGSTYRLVFVPPVGRSITSGDASDGFRPTQAPVAGIERVATKPSKVSTERPGDLAGRYAILRDKTHDTGCMLTLDDKTRVKGGARAALAPACRDQGIVIFDPSAWSLVNGRLVLMAKAGHMTHLDKQEDGSWLKDPAEGKSLTLKKL